MRIRLILAALILTCALSAGFTSRTIAADSLETNGAELPSGPELMLVQTDCQICHSLDLVTSQRLSVAVWTAEVAKMVRWGSPLTADQQPAVVAYLAKYLAPSVPRKINHPAVPAPPITYNKAPAP
jgi:hypothetical protein